MSSDRDRLQTIRICTDTAVETVIHCWLIDAMASHIMSKTPELLWRPYYNTPLVPMLHAQANEQIVRLYAFLCGTALCTTCRAAKGKQKACAEVRCGKSLGDGLPLRGLDHLKNHRDVLGHPLSFQLDRPGVVKFVEDKRDRRDVRPALVWDIHRSIVDAQVAAGEAATVLEMAVGPSQTNVLDSILRLCLKPGIPPMPEDWLTGLLTNLWKEARVDFEKYPDGQFPKKTDAELAAVYEKAKNVWFASR